VNSFMKPQFLCVGFAKCGTTTLHEILKQHKDVKLPMIKEPFFYANYNYYKRGFQWYIRRYYGPNNAKNKLVGEINPLIESNFNAKRIYKDFGPNLKLIFIMRNPVDRLFSDFKMWLLWGACFKNPQDNILDENTFSKFLDQFFEYEQETDRLHLKKQHPLINRGLYYKHIESYLKYFPRENMKFIVFEEFIKDPKKSCEEIYEFLGLKKQKGIDYTVKANSGNRSPRNIYSIKFGHFWINSCWKWITGNLPYISETVCNRIDKIYWKMFDLISKKDEKKYLMNDMLRKRLENYYREDKERLEILLGRDLTDLWYE